MTDSKVIELVNLAGWDAVDLEDGFGERIKKFADLVAAAEREACNGLWEAQRLTDSQISDHIEAAVAAEREACAKVAEDYKESCYAGDLDWYLAKYIVDEIKARGKE
jgi:hypothetical protein